MKPLARAVALIAILVGLFGTYEFFSKPGKAPLQFAGPFLLVGGLLTLALLNPAWGSSTGETFTHRSPASQAIIGGLWLMLVPTLGTALGALFFPNSDSEALGMLVTAAALLLGVPGLFFATGGAIAEVIRAIKNRSAASSG